MYFQGSLLGYHVIRYIEKEISFKRGKGLKSRSILVCSETDDEDSEYKNVEKSPPRLFLFVKNNELEHACITADGCTIPCESGDDFNDALILLLATYYTFDLSYPRIYSQILGILQQYVLNDPYNLEKSTDYKHFVAQYGNQFEF